MINLSRAFKNNRLMKALTGMSTSEFRLLALTFEKMLYLHFASKKRLRGVGGGRKGALRNAESKLFFTLFYIKIYPTYDMAGFIFDVDRTRCYHWTKCFFKILEKALGHTIKMPKRRISSFDELMRAFPEIKEVFLDSTERRVQRPKKAKLQKKRYSGKKKCHTRKNTIISDNKRQILYISPSTGGRTHDFTHLKKLILSKEVPKDLTIWADKGYIGLKSALDANNHNIIIPHKKPKNKELTKPQKEENRIIPIPILIILHRSSFM